MTLRLLKCKQRDEGAVLWGLQLAQSVDTNDQAFRFSVPLLLALSHTLKVVNCLPGPVQTPDVRVVARQRLLQRHKLSRESDELRFSKNWALLAR